MEKREIYKQTEISGRKWRIGKFDALTGSYIAYTLMSDVLPLALNAKVGIPAPKTGNKMSKESFMDLQKDCLKVCCEMLPAGPTPVIDENGNWGVTDAEHDTPLVLNLTIQALIWNVQSFFDESLLASLAESISGISLQGVPTSMSSSTPQS